MKKVLLFILVLTSLCTCKKKNLEYEISGTVYDKSLNKSMAGVDVTISVSKNSGFYDLATVTTDNEGKYSYKLLRENYHQIRIQVAPTHYFDQNSTTTLEGLSLDKPNTFDFNLYAQSWVRLHFVSDGSKQLRYYKQAGKSGCDACCEAGEKQVNFKVDTSIFCINDGNTPYQIFYDVMGGTDSGTKNVTTVAFDTTEILVNY